MIVYKITNIINGKVYIGQTTRSLRQRWLEHCRSNNKCSAIRNAIDKYGKNSFTLEIVDTANCLEELNKKESKYIKQLNCIRPNGYNLREEGQNKSPSLEARENMSQGQLRRMSNPEELRKNAIRAKKQWENKNYKNKMIEKIRKRSKDPKI